MNASAARIADYRNRDLAAEVTQLHAERDQLRALVLLMSDAFDLAEQNAYKSGYLAALDSYAQGWADGYEHGARIADVQFRPIANRLINEPTFAELELLRWGPGGREHFGDPRPGDFPGQVTDLNAWRSRRRPS